MIALVPCWRADAQSARRLYELADDLSDADVIKAAEQVRYQRCGDATLPVWLQALDGFAWASPDDHPRWQSDSDERELLLQLVACLDRHPDAQVLVFGGAQDLVRRLRLRCLIAGLSSSFVADWSARFVDGQHWQPEVLQAEPEAMSAVLALASPAAQFSAWTPGSAEDVARSQVAALLEIASRGWL